MLFKDRNPGEDAVALWKTQFCGQTSCARRAQQPEMVDKSQNEPSSSSDLLGGLSRAARDPRARRLLG